MHIKIPLKLYLSFVIILSGFSSLAQEANWESYIIQKEKGPMAITVNMDLNFARPNYKYLVMAGIHTSKCLKNGYPNAEGLSKLYEVSDSIADIVESSTKSRLAGIITYQCAGFDIFYVKDTTGLKSKITNFFNSKHEGSKRYIEIAQDRKWVYYNESLFPKKLEEDFFINQEFLTQLVIEGDDLKKERKVTHWIYFKSERRRKKFMDKIKVLNFDIVSFKVKHGQALPYELEIARKDLIDPKSIANLTTGLKRIANTLYGVYDGWGAELLEED